MLGNALRLGCGGVGLNEGLMGPSRYGGESELTGPKVLSVLGNRSVDGLEFRHWPEGLGAEALAAAFAHAGHPRYRSTA